MLKKIVLIEYNTNLKNWDINHIKQVEKTYDKVSKDIQHQK